MRKGKGRRYSTPTKEHFTAVFYFCCNFIQCTSQDIQDTATFHSCAVGEQASTFSGPSQFKIALLSLSLIVALQVANFIGIYWCKKSISDNLALNVLALQSWCVILLFSNERMCWVACTTVHVLAAYDFCQELRKKKQKLSDAWPILLFWLSNGIIHCSCHFTCTP